MHEVQRTRVDTLRTQKNRFHLHCSFEWLYVYLCGWLQSGPVGVVVGSAVRQYGYIAAHVDSRVNLGTLSPGLHVHKTCQWRQGLGAFFFSKLDVLTNPLKNKTTYPHGAHPHVRQDTRKQFTIVPDKKSKQSADTLLTMYNSLVQLAFERLNLSSQCLHLLGLRGDRLGLLGDQILDLFDVAGNCAGGHAWFAGGG